MDARQEEKGKEEGREVPSPNGISLFTEIFLETYIQQLLLDTGEVGNAISLASCWPKETTFSEEGKGRGGLGVETAGIFCHMGLFLSSLSIAFLGSPDHRPRAVCMPHCLLSHSKVLLFALVSPLPPLPEIPGGPDLVCWLRWEQNRPGSLDSPSVR